MQLKQLYDRWMRFANHLQDPLLFLMRCYWGWGFIEAGKGKFVNLERATEAFTSFHIPYPFFNVIVAASFELVGGILLLLGVMARIITVPLIVIMCVAYLTAHMDVVRALFHDPEQFIGADPFLFLLTSLLILAFGPGRWSLDAWFTRRS